ncbi:hypothetical protein MHYP_G00051480 [Metynnis hypsauchen]
MRDTTGVRLRRKAESSVCLLKVVICERNSNTLMDNRPNNNSISLSIRTAHYTTTDRRPTANTISRSSNYSGRITHHKPTHNIQCTARSWDPRGFAASVIWSSDDHLLETQRKEKWTEHNQQTMSMGVVSLMKSSAAESSPKKHKESDVGMLYPKQESGYFQKSGVAFLATAMKQTQELEYERQILPKRK